MNKKTQISLFGQVSDLKISYSPKTRPSDRAKITSSQQAFEIFYNGWEDIAYYESFKVMALNRANKVLGVALISKGGIAGTVADPKIIMQYAVLSNACSIILAHNHPSGSLQTSEADRTITRKIKEACNFLDISCLDHIVISPEGRFFSFADEGLI